MSKVLCAVVLALFLTPFLRAQSASKKAGAATSSASLASALESEIRQAWQNFKDKKKEAFGSALTDDNTQVWADGKPPRDKATTLKDIDDWTLNSYSLSDFKVTPIGPNAAVATYRAKVAGDVKGQKIDSNLEVTDLWVKRGNDWKELRYHESELK